MMRHMKNKILRGLYLYREDTSIDALYINIINSHELLGRHITRFLPSPTLSPAVFPRGVGTRRQLNVGPYALESTFKLITN